MNKTINKVVGVIFPQDPRDFAYRRVIRIALRATHILCAGVLLGGWIFTQPVNELEPWLIATVLTGLLIMTTDLHASASVFFEIRGLAVILKIGLLLVIPFYPYFSIPVLVSALFIGVFASHMPKRYRHKILFFEKYFVPDQRSG